MFVIRPPQSCLPSSMKLPTEDGEMQGEPKVHWPKVLASMKVPPKRKGNPGYKKQGGGGS